MNFISIIQNEIENHPNWKKVMTIFTTKKGENIDYGDWENDARAWEIAKLLNLEMLGFGERRVVLKTQTYAIKIPLEPVGIEENRNELELWNTSALKEHLTPCLGGNEHLLFFEIVEEISIEEFQYNEDEILNILDLFEREGIFFEDGENERWEQWTSLKGTWKLCDYGCYVKK